MIRSVLIRNFESHKETRLDLATGLNVLVGESDAGKSGIFRALNWVLNNRPLGDAVVPLFWNSKATEVVIEFMDGKTITKRKPKSGGSEYLVDGVLLTGFGTDVPKEVRDAFAMDEISFQEQVALPFLMFESPGERARVLNRVSGLDEIDRTFVRASSDLRRVRAEVDAAESRVASLGERLKKYEDVDARVELVEAAEKIEQTIEEQEAIHAKASRVIVDLATVEEKIHVDREWIEERERLITSAVDAVRSWSTETDRLARILESVTRVEEIEEILDARNALEFSSVSERLSSASNLLSVIREESSRHAEIIGVIDAISRIDEEIRGKEKECDALARRIPARCPTCGTSLARTR